MRKLGLSDSVNLAYEVYLARRRGLSDKAISQSFGVSEAEVESADAAIKSVVLRIAQNATMGVNG